MTGNTVADAVKYNLGISVKESDILGKMNLKNRDYFLLTAHRQENVD